MAEYLIQKRRFRLLLIIGLIVLEMRCLGMIKEDISATSAFSSLTPSETGQTFTGNLDSFTIGIEKCHSVSINVDVANLSDTVNNKRMRLKVWVAYMNENKEYFEFDSNYACEIL
jgi:hypothetical protein